MNENEFLGRYGPWDAIEPAEVTAEPDRVSTGAEWVLKRDGLTLSRHG
jgi:hypothetical protein